MAGGSVDTRVVVVGGGMAGARLARQLGAAPGTAVTVLAEEPHPAYNRVLLAEVLAGRYPAEVIALPRPGAHVVWRAGTRVARIDRAARAVECADGTRLDYDALVLATGSHPVLPPLRGLLPPGGGELPDGVHPFRTLDDCLALRSAVSAAGPAPRAVVIGGGLLGVSAARALAELGAHVVLAHQGEHLLERHVDPDAGALLRDHLAARGVEVHTECRARGVVTARGTHRVTGVRLADGYALDAELVVLACGVRPRVGLARAAGLALGARGGIVVDDRLRCPDDPRVYAVGDCAEHRGVLHGLAGAAQDQADVLARGLGGDPDARYGGTRALVRLTLPEREERAGRDELGFGPLDLAAFGETSPAPGDDVVRLADATRGAYRRIVVRGDRLRGGVLLGDLGGVAALAGAWESDEALPASPLLHLLTHDGGY
ncbi:NAD(P)/FAD-dependent oxidoreductase [Streptomyces radicis]|uniref:NAD(P)/FAD-dependent oxidoreductase n=1 Tax=Streptomyces radicis TaxID=1750517 RepID=A0A3A9WVZ8_9ACTN|nr:FAD-dependent oxidoreductase [Streptomyces radicis]RKN11986.1 NAD(P)/FAD-dependent oxidoreductase [Streptomyces radicis]RKN25963.1 NAD(P)/FAD-dependent oxidoreductase [Streptomyces radicis]